MNSHNDNRALRKSTDGPRPNRLTRKEKFGSSLSRRASELHSRNTRRYTIMRLTQAIHHVPIDCSEEDAKCSNQKFYDTLIEYINATETDYLDELDRQQMNILHTEDAFTSTTYLRALAIQAAGCEDHVLDSPVEIVPVPLTGDFIQLSIGEKVVCSMEFVQRENKSQEMNKLSCGNTDQSTLSVTAKSSKKPFKKALRDKLRLDAYIAAKNAISKTVTHLATNGDEQNSVETHANGTSLNSRDATLAFGTSINSRSPEGETTHAHGTSINNRISTSINPSCRRRMEHAVPVLTSQGECRIENFRRCSSMYCVERNAQIGIQSTNVRSCPCMTPLTHSLTQIEMGAIKYVLLNTRKIIMTESRCGINTHYFCELDEPERRITL